MECKLRNLWVSQFGVAPEEERPPHSPPPPIFEFITNAFLLFDPFALVTCPMTIVYTVHTRYFYDFARPARVVVNKFG
jgi:hypothetical protein